MPPGLSPAVTRPITVVTYAVLGSILCWSRLVGLGAGYCCDEIRTVEDYVREGPRTILTGAYIPNNHELFSLLGWATSSVIGESEIALRLWSVLPFLVGVVVVTAWLHIRMGALSALLFLFLATFSPLLADISRMARGYGLAFLAMSVLIVAALELERTGRGLALVGFLAAGVVGSLTLPHFAIAFVATAIALLARRDVRLRVAIGTGLAALVVFAWYAPHLDDIAVSTLGEYGRQIDTAWLITAPIDQTLVPAVTLLDDAFLRPSLASLLWALAFAVLIASSPLLRRTHSALILCSGVVLTVIAFWLTGTYVVPRFLSFLLVPLFVLVATGSASILARVPTRAARLRAIVVIATFGLIALLSTPLLVDISRLPRDSTREAALSIKNLVPAATPVYAHVPYPLDLEFHLGRSVNWSMVPRRDRRGLLLRRVRGLRRRSRSSSRRQTSRVPDATARATTASSSTPADRRSMSGSSLQPSPEQPPAGSRLAVVAAYGVLGAALLWSRLFQLGHSFWVDEISMVESFVRAGPREILTSPGLNHQLMALLSWVTTSVVGESEIALRLLSAVPFIAGVALVTVWLHARIGALSGVLFLFLATVSPLLLDITRQARGYGLAFLAMSVLVVAALEATRTGSSWAVVAMCIGGVVGTWTLPQFGFAFLATGVVVAIDRRVRLSTAIGLVVSVAAIVAWYAPHSGDVRVRGGSRTASRSAFHGS